jgi:hypothetical protein
MPINLSSNLLAHMLSLALIRSAFAGFALLSLTLTCFAGTNPNAPLGTNLTAVTDFSDEFPFVDLMKSARDWTPGNANGCFDCRTPGTNPNCLAPNACPVTFNKDANGFLTSLQPNQIARLVLHAGGTPGRLPLGSYTMRFDGAGSFNFAGASTMSSSVGAAVFSIASSTGNNVIVNFTAIDAANPLRNIKILPPGGVCSNDDRTFCSASSACTAPATCSLYSTPGVAEAQIFQPRFLQNTDPFRVLRYMDWMETNSSPIVSVADYPVEASAFWQRVPISVLAKLGNRTASDIWINIPHRASDAFVDAMATTLRDQFRADRKIYLEFSNENWNGLFSQNREIPRQFCPGYPDLAAGCQNDGIPGNGIACELNSSFSLGAAGGPCFQALVRGWGDRSVQVFDRFDSVFGASARQRLLRVVASQAANPDLGRQVLARNATGQSFTVASKTDAYASAPYIGTEYCTPDSGINPDTHAAVYANVDAFLNHFETLGMARALGFMSASKSMLSTNFPSLRHLAYEGGQHLAGIAGFTFNSTCNSIFDAANRSPRMQGIYETYWSNWKQNGDEFAHFSNVGRYSVFGRWTLLEFQDQDISTAPKFRAMLNHSTANPCHWPGCTQVELPAEVVFLNGFEG